eukprot:scaffold129_cov66-Phaeocystis_antarctica.AAC.3
MQPIFAHPLYSRRSASATVPDKKTGFGANASSVASRQLAHIRGVAAWHRCGRRAKRKARAVEQIANLVVLVNARRVPLSHLGLRSDAQVQEVAHLVLLLLAHAPHEFNVHGCRLVAELRNASNNLTEPRLQLRRDGEGAWRLEDRDQLTWAVLDIACIRHVHRPVGQHHYLGLILSAVRDEWLHVSEANVRRCCPTYLFRPAKVARPLIVENA